MKISSDMKKRIVIMICLAVLTVAAFATVILLKQHFASKEDPASTEDEIVRAVFPFEYTDRIAGHPATDKYSDSSTIEIKFGSFAFARKTYAVSDNSGDADYEEKYEKEVGGIAVTFMGAGGKVCRAVWIDNNFAYTIGINAVSNGISEEEMKEYVKNTR